MQLPTKQKIGETTIEIDKIRLDGGTQPREALDEAVAREYGEAMSANGITSFPPVDIYYDGTDYWLADGFHRVKGAKLFHIQSLRANVQQGTRRDAVLHSVGVNASHGLRRTNADKRRSVMTLLNDEEWRQWGDREIARRCAVAHSFVIRMRESLVSETSESDKRTYVNRYGQVATMNTANIGKTKLYKCDGCGEKFETVYVDLKTGRNLCKACYDGVLAQRKADRDAAIEVAKGLLSPDRWYPVNHGEMSIYNDPFDSQKDGHADQRYKFSFAIQNGKIILDGIERFGNYAKYQIVDALPREEEPEPEPAPVLTESEQSDNSGKALTLKYQPGMKARCGKCTVHYPGFDDVHTDWALPDPTKPVWQCPHHHRIADCLMDIVQDEQAAVAMTPAPQSETVQPLETATIGQLGDMGLRSHPQPGLSYDEKQKRIAAREFGLILVSIRSQIDEMLKGAAEIVGDYLDVEDSQLIYDRISNDLTELYGYVDARIDRLPMKTVDGVPVY